MAFPRLFKKVKKAEAEPAAEKVESKAEIRPEKDRGARRMLGVIIAPHQTEKATAAAGQGWYTFRVRDAANKIMVKRAVEERYGVEVERVRVIYARPKKIRRGRIIGQAPGLKKAMVKVREGQSIEFT